MADQIEMLKREVGALEAKQADLQRKQLKAQALKAELEGKRQTLLTKIAEGDDPARRDLGQVDAGLEDASVDAEAYQAAATATAARLGAMQQALARASRDAAINAVEVQISSVGGLNDKVEGALASVRHATDALLSAVASIAHELELFDAQRFGSAFHHRLKTAVVETVYHRFQELALVPNTLERRPSFIERTEGVLRSALAQLRYQNLEGNITPKGKERRYRVTSRITGLRDLDLLPGNLIALTEAEAGQFLETGFLEMADEQAA